MITQVKIQLSSQEKIRISSDFAYNIYGVWMDVLKPEYADYVHETHPMNQFLTVNRTNPDTALLTINLLTVQAAEYMLPVLKNTRQYHLTKHNCTLSAREPVIIIITEEELVNSYFTSPQYSNRVTLQLMSPTTFKTNSHYAIFPTPELIIQSTVAKFNMLGLSVNVEDELAVQQLMENTMITNYRLNSTRYYFKDTRIQSFVGSVTLCIHGSEPMVRLFSMLMGALRYTGLGIKTSLGMGGVEII